MFRKITLSVCCAILLLLIATLFMRSDLLGKSQAQCAYLEALPPNIIIARNGKSEEVRQEWRESQTMSITILQSQDHTDQNEFYSRIDWKGEARWLNTDQYAAYERLWNPYRVLLQLGLIPIVYALFLWVYDMKEQSTSRSHQRRKRCEQTLSQERLKELEEARAARKEKHRLLYSQRRRSNSGGRR